MCVCMRMGGVGMGLITSQSKILVGSHDFRVGGWICFCVAAYFCVCVCPYLCLYVCLMCVWVVCFIFQAKIMERASHLRSLLSTHHKLISDIRSILKTMAKVRDTLFASCTHPLVLTGGRARSFKTTGSSISCRLEHQAVSV